jgi:hypothetical protein
MHTLRTQTPVLFPPDEWESDVTMGPGTGLPLFSPWFHLTDARTGWIVHGLTVLVAILFTLGEAEPQPVGALAWVLTLGAIHRLPAATSVDVLLAVVLLYLMLAPCGAALSVDRLLQRTPPQPSVSANVVLRLMQIHFCIICIAVATTMLQTPAWWNTTAPWQIVGNREFSPAVPELLTSALLAVAQSKPAWEILNTCVTVFVVALFFAIPYLVWRRSWRGPLLTAFVVVQTVVALVTGQAASALLLCVLAAAFFPRDRALSARESCG